MSRVCTHKEHKIHKEPYVRDNGRTDGQLVVTGWNPVTHVREFCDEGFMKPKPRYKKTKKSRHEPEEEREY